jgi:hypothetical protein
MNGPTPSDSTPNFLEKWTKRYQLSAINRAQNTALKR